MSRTRVVVTGLGATTPLGGDAPSTWEALLAGRPASAASRPTGPPTCRSRSRRRSRSTRARCWSGSRPAAWTARPSWPWSRPWRPGRDAGFGLQEDNPVDRDRLGVAIATGIGGLHTLLGQWDVQKEKGARRVSPLAIPMLMANASAGNVSLRLGAQAGAHTPVSACASSNEAISLGLDMIRLGRADVVVVGGTEACIHPMPIACFAQMQAMSRRNDEPERASRPWDVDRDGFVLGEGAAMLVIETLEHAQARGARIYGELAGAGITADAHDMVQPNPTGETQARAMTKALREADLAPATSSTSTPTPPRPRRATSPRPARSGRRSARTPRRSSPAPSR